LIHENFIKFGSAQIAHSASVEGAQTIKIPAWLRTFESVP
jgi:hypothetical protein